MACAKLFYVLMYKTLTIVRMRYLNLLVYYIHYLLCFKIWLEVRKQHTFTYPVSYYIFNISTLNVVVHIRSLFFLYCFILLLSQRSFHFSFRFLTVSIDYLAKLLCVLYITALHFRCYL